MREAGLVVPRELQAQGAELLLSWWPHIDELQVESDHTRYIIPLSQSDRLLPDTVLVEYRREEPLLLAKGAWQWLSASISVAEAGGNH